MKKYKFGTWLYDWVNVYKKPYIKSYKSLLANIRLHIPKEVKEIDIKELNVIDIQKVINNVEFSRVAVEVYNILHSSLHLAYKLELIDKDISAFLVKPKHKRKIGTALSISELSDLFINSYPNLIYYYFKFLLLTGCRRTEGLNVTWEDVDFEKKFIHIKGTKTDTSDRYLPLYSDLENLLNDIKHNSYWKNHIVTGKIFHHKPNYVTHTFKKYCPNHKLHDLRHTFATRCIECGISLKTVQLWLGHADFDTTANIYSHVLPDFAKLESKKLKFF